MKSISAETEDKFIRLKEYLSTLESAALAYSGGVDSTLLLYTASLIEGLKLTAYTINNDMITADEIESATVIAEKLNIRHRILNVDILSFSEVMSNSPLRCYYCKKIILNRIITEALSEGINTVMEGSHSGDLYDYRPGLRAIEEMGVLSPLKAAEFNKKDIYELSAHLELPTSGKESYPCLATRIPYGIPLSSHILRKAAVAEAILSSFGFRKIRARLHTDVLRIEIAEEMIPVMASDDIRKKVYSALQNAGFTYITLDLQGYRTGSMNINLEDKT